jgi:hypothetical protein
MAKAFELITTVTVGAGGQSSIDFTSISNGYTDLFVVFSLRTTLTGGPYHFDDCAIRFNGDTGNNYNRVVNRAREGGVASGSTISGNLIALYEASAADATANTFGSGQAYIADYASTAYKSVSIMGASESNNQTQVQFGFISGLWKSTSAITSIKLYSQNGTNFVQHSSASLYGIKKS